MLLLLFSTSSAPDPLPPTLLSGMRQAVHRAATWCLSLLGQLTW